MSYLASIGFNRAGAAVEDAIIVPAQRPYLAPIIYLHGAGATASELSGSQWTSTIRTINTMLAEAGYPIAAPTATALWGNSTAAARLTAAKSWLVNTHGAPDVPAILIGVSHGCAWALNYAAANPSLVAGIISFLPIVDLTAVRDGNLSGLRAGIDAAWGVTFPTPLPVESDPVQNTAVLADIPQQHWYASNDALSVSLDDYATATGAEIRDEGALGHDDAVIAAADTADILAFVEEHT